MPSVGERAERWREETDVVEVDRILMFTRVLNRVPGEAGKEERIGAREISREK